MNRRHVTNFYKRAIFIVFISIPLFIFLDIYLKNLNQNIAILIYIIIGGAMIGLFEGLRKIYIKKIQSRLDGSEK